MQNPPVHWYEGLFLCPHHLQASDRHWTDATQTSQRWDHPYNYGLHALEFSRDAISNHQFEIHRLEARMADGTLVSLDGGQTLDRLNLREGLEHESEVRVYLAIAKLKLGRANVESTESIADARYNIVESKISDESEGGNEQDIQFRELKVRLLLSTDDASGYELLPIAQIKRSSEGDPRPQCDDQYIPPVISIDVWPELGRDIVRSIYDLIGQKIEVLSDQVSSRGIGLDSQSPGDMDRILMLSQLNSAYNTLGVLAFAKGVHPLVAYTELCRIVGNLSIFSESRRAEEVPPYDHDDLARIFRIVKLKIEQLINAVREYQFEQRFFVGVGMGMQVTLEPNWFHSNWQWFVGVNKGDLTRQECRELLSSGQLDWKLGSGRQVELLFKHRAEGVELHPVDRPPRALPAKSDWIYFELPRSESSAWRDVQETQTLAMRLKDSLIVNLDQLQGGKDMVVSSQGRKTTLQFALFAVPTQS